jgi:hypothetical protein
MTEPSTCPECGAPWSAVDACQTSFHQMGAWEFENPSVIPEAHHLMVLCYHLQHPSLYSPDGLRWARTLLVDFLERGLTTQEVRRRYRAALDSGNRTHKIKGTPESHGAYERPVGWTMTAVDVTNGGAERYVESVKRWAQSVLDCLRASGNLT